MKKNLLTLGLITLGVSASAQVLTYVGPGATMTITSNALVYSGGGWQNANSNATVATPEIVLPKVAPNGLLLCAVQFPVD